MTMLFSNWTFHSSLTMMSNVHVCHLQMNTLYWIPQKNNASQVDGDLRTQVHSNNQMIVNMFEYQLSQLLFARVFIEQIMEWNQ